MTLTRRPSASLVTLVGAVAVFAALLLAVVLSFQPVLRFDNTANARLHRVAMTHTGWTAAMRDISRIGAPLTWLLILTPTVVYLLLRRRLMAAIWVAASTVGSAALNLLVKTTVDRPRPTSLHPVASAAGWSFPSGHAQAATVACALLVTLLRPLLRARWQPVLVAGAVAITALIAFSRVALGVHYPSDVVAGIGLGTGWVLLMSFVTGINRWCGAWPAALGRNGSTQGRDSAPPPR